MYGSTPSGQLSFENFYLPFGGKLSGENRWVKLAELIPWDEVELEYAQQFSSSEGAPAKSCRVGLGALIIKERLGASDEETVEQIRENPDLQYFLGFYEYRDKAPFEASMFVHFRKRFTVESVGRINEKMVKLYLDQLASQPEAGSLDAIDVEMDQSEAAESDGNESDGEESEGSESAENRKPDKDNTPVFAESEETQTEPPETTNQGDLILDATCAPGDIQYPTDLRLLNEAREHTEAIIDALYELVRDTTPTKPRTYRRKARRDYLNTAKKRRPTAKQRRQAIRKQLAYVRRNLAHIDALVNAGAALSKLTHRQYRTLLVVSEVFRQQQWMYEQRSSRIDDRIVSLAQPHVRPIIRGKAGGTVEFGPKLSASCSDGFVYLDHLSWHNFNESGDLQSQAETYKARFGHYPETIYADQIYRTRANRKWCKERGIRLMGLPLGRPAKDKQAALRRQLQEDEKIRNQIEGKFGQGKRRFSLARVMAKLAPIAETSIAVCFLVMNLERLLRQVLFFIFCLFVQWISRQYSNGRRQRRFSMQYQPA